MKSLLFVVLIVMIGCKSTKEYSAVKDYPDMDQSSTVLAGNRPENEAPAAKEELPPVQEVPVQEIPKADVSKVAERIVMRSESLDHPDAGELNRFYIVIGSFANEFNANSLRRILADLSFEKSCILQNKDGLYRVAIDQYDDERKARQALILLRTEYPQYMEAWLLVPQK